MRADWVTYFLLTAASSLSLPRILAAIAVGMPRTSIQLFLLALAALNIIAAILIAFENLGGLASVVVVGSGFFLFPILRGQLLSKPLVVLAAGACVFAAVLRA